MLSQNFFKTLRHRLKTPTSKAFMSLGWEGAKSHPPWSSLLRSRDVKSPRPTSPIYIYSEYFGLPANLWTEIFPKSTQGKTKLNSQVYALLLSTFRRWESCLRHRMNKWWIRNTHPGSLTPGWVSSATRPWCYVTVACIWISLNLGFLISKRHILIHIWQRCDKQSIESSCQILSNALEHRDQ